MSDSTGLHLIQLGELDAMQCVQSKSGDRTRVEAEQRGREQRAVNTDSAVGLFANYYYGDCDTSLTNDLHRPSLAVYDARVQLAHNSSTLLYTPPADNASHVSCTGEAVLFATQRYATQPSRRQPQHWTYQVNRQ